MSDYEDNHDADYEAIEDNTFNDEEEETQLTRKPSKQQSSLSISKQTLLGDPNKHKIVTILGEPECGKTSLIKYMLREAASTMGALLLIGNAVFDDYEKDYTFVNKRFCYKDIEDPDQLIGDFLTTAHDIMTLDPMRRSYMVIDDATGMLKSIMQEKKWKHLISCIRKYNVNLIIVLHSFQREAVALLKAAMTHLFIGPYKEEGTLKIVKGNWVKGSSPFATESGVDFNAFDRSVMAKGQGNPEGLDKHNFLLWRSDLDQGPRWERIPKLPLPPPYRIILCEEDKKYPGAVYGNKEMWDFSKLENPEAMKKKSVGNIEERRKNAAKRLLGKRAPDTNSDVEAPVESEKDSSERDTPSKRGKTTIVSVEESNNIDELLQRIKPKTTQQPSKTSSSSDAQNEENEELRKENAELIDANAKLSDVNRRLQALYQLRFIAQTESLKKPVLSILGPDFFPKNTHDYGALKTDELIKLRDMVDQAMVVNDTYVNIENQYTIATTATEFCAKMMFGFDGKMGAELFAPNIAANAYYALGQIDFNASTGKPYEPDPWNRMLALVEPGLRWLMWAKEQQDSKNLLENVGDLPVDESILQQYESIVEDV